MSRTNTPAGKGERVTAKRLEIGQSYLHRNGWGYRTITAIHGGEVTYRQDSGYIGVCKAANFVNACPTVATDSEIEYVHRNFSL